MNNRKKKLPEKTFEEVLAELDQMILNDIELFKRNLKKLSVRENTDQFFESEINLEEEFHDVISLENLSEFPNLAENTSNVTSQLNSNKNEFETSSYGED